MNIINKFDTQLKSVARAFDLIEILSKHNRCGITELSKMMQISKSGVYRIITTLEEAGIVRQDPSKKYHLSLKLFELGKASLKQFGFIDRCQQLINQLAEITGEAIHVAVREESSAVYIMYAESVHSLQILSRVGRRVPLHCTGSGKAFLAYMNLSSRDLLLQKLKSTEHNINLDLFIEELEEIRNSGYAISAEELEKEVISIAAPILDYSGEIKAALSIAGPSFRITKDQITMWKKDLLNCASSLSQYLIDLN